MLGFDNKKYFPKFPENSRPTPVHPIQPETGLVTIHWSNLVAI
jgi:hypothetical protein